MLQLLPKIGPDLISGLVADKRSQNTKRAYEADLKHFFQVMGGRQPDPEAVFEFLQLQRFEANQIVMAYKSKMLEQGLSEATVNRRLASLKSLVRYGRKLGFCNWELSDIQGEKVQVYRDTSGISAEQMQAMFDSVDVTTLKGLRDRAILRIFWSNALRRNEVVQCNVKDFEGNRLWILGKGKGSQKESVELLPKAEEAIAAWLDVYGPESEDAPLFPSITKGEKIEGRISGEGVSKMVQKYAVKAGIKKRVTPHRLRHSSITSALQITNGNVDIVRKLSRHAKVETLLIYRDNTGDEQRRVSELLENLV